MFSTMFKNKLDFPAPDGPLSTNLTIMALDFFACCSNLTRLGENDPQPNQHAKLEIILRQFLSFWYGIQFDRLSSDWIFIKQLELLKARAGGLHFLMV